MPCSPGPTCATSTAGPAPSSCPTRRKSCGTPTFRSSSSPEMPGAPATRVLVHADESCLGNGTDPPNPGGNAALVEAPAGDSVARWDIYECSPDTTNQKMALAGAIATLEWLHRQWKRARVIYVPDSEYLIKAITNRVPASIPPRSP